jgi:peptidoglycan hydrolase CwlO-like protein
MLLELSSTITIIGALSAVVGAIGSYFLGRKQAKTNDFNILIKANEQFRDEIRGELTDARKIIEELRQAMRQKDREVESLKASIEELQNEIMEKDRRISDLKINLMQKDIKIAELESRIGFFEEKK